VILELDRDLSAQDAAGLARLPSAQGARASGPQAWTIESPVPGLLLVELSGWLLERGLVPRSIRHGGPSLEELFIRLTGESSGDAKS
jgi:hypothetical protein